MKLSTSQRALLEKRAAEYQRQLGSEALEYLSRERGLDDEVARSWRLGQVVDPLPGDDRYLGRLAVPYLTRSGVVAIRFRDLTGQAQAKYLGDPGAETHLFNTAAVFSAGRWIAVAEGEIDAITLTEIGIPSIGIPGASNWKAHYARILEDFERVYVFTDGDSAGRKFGQRVAEEVSGVVVIEMPAGMDVNSVYTEEVDGAEWLRSKIGLSS